MQVTAKRSRGRHSGGRSRGLENYRTRILEVRQEEQREALSSAAKQKNRPKKSQNQTFIRPYFYKKSD